MSVAYLVNLDEMKERAKTLCHHLSGDPTPDIILTLIIALLAVTRTIERHEDVVDFDIVTPELLQQTCDQIHNAVRLH